MAPIEVFFGAILFVFMMIGLVRGFLRELGVTLVVMFLLFFLNLFEPTLNRGLVRALDAGRRLLPASQREVLQCWLYILVVIGVAFISYEGETLAFGGQPPKGVQGFLLGALTGLLNGYLVAGSIWYYMDKYNYPIRFLGFSSDKLSNLARTLIDFLPIRFLGQPIAFGQGLLLYLSALLILARVIR